MQLVKHGGMLLAISVFFFSCNDKFMDRFPETEIGAESFFNSEEDLRLYTQGMYDFPSTGIYSSDSYTLTDNGGSTGNVELKTMMMGNPNSATITSGWDWGGLRRANIFLANFGKAAISQERLDHYEGLGRFFRARFYVPKVKRYSDVPWIDQPVGTSSEDILYGSRDSRELVVNKIIEDYEFAAAKVDLSARPGAVTRWVVKADFARFLLYEGTFRKYHPELGLEGSAATLLQKAASVAKDIMDNGGYSLFANYSALFYSANLVGNSEIIFTRRYEANVLNGDAGDGFFGNYEAYPSKDMLQAYLMKDGSFYSSQPNYQQNEFVEEFTDRDPRLYATYAYPGWELVRTGTYSRGAGIYVQQLQKNFSGYHQIKGFYNTTIQNERNDIDVPLYRYAEILLIYAEAKAELGQLTQGDLNETVNLLRDRAGMPHLAIGAPIDPVEAARFPNVTGSFRGEIYEIRRERRVELAFEGFRHDDLMRWETGKTLETEPLGLHFRSLGYHDLTGDGIPDIKLLPYAEAIPNDRENNALGKPLEYYRVGTFGQTDASIFLSGPSSGSMLIIEDIGAFVAPKYYYRPVPQMQMSLNSSLKQIFGWE
ncbi:MAG: RagB/SusD family nutrient uptake outer membrane protein [Chitinophagaceae bacterium]|nr:RagB/SusD family nutrient uptake outer membrane protein [Chitinophagaceae bacterium]MCW5927043.1 RagB/SusD family nutrient uptake outer membrane protein [Chitinophagaceae bacterium]